MERRPPSEPKRSGKEKARKGAAAAAADGGDEEEVAAGEEEDKKRRPPAPAPASSAARRGSGGGGASQPCCQAEKCTADLTEAKRYHRRHKVCEAHSKAPVVIVAGLRQRFCQQCSSAGSMRYQSLMTLRGVAVDAWLATMSGAERVLLNHRERDPAAAGRLIKMGGFR
ncbi:uncharacterized protein [Elaeis guineensis]|uniref:Squamosa promoter-binding-like protein 13 isoform X2 n=1 Tax=Elaeis guineensis var. tenera TaxID=51953 RepID=A0A6I9RM19_ELAGV|nr:squamosa promoter-binding-like protein 13 isoform X2 [Elaeis guineensis]